MMTRTGFVAKKVSFQPKKDDENGSRRQKNEFPAKKRRREWVSSPKMSVSRLKKTTRKDLVAKKMNLPAQKDDENGFRRQKNEFPAKKRRRERISSPKMSVSRLKKTTRTDFVAKKMSFPAKKDDEKGFRRQKSEFPAKKRRRERISSPKMSVSRLKKTTRTGLVAKKVSFQPKKDDENGFRRQKKKFSE
ncbi:hypothetical protein P9386_12405 [Caldifermentibacillus hisashii]|uniref:hypothetical protein n=1 Tax=Caldifermentibacillus hisashii TaxID=996558 RepID=UPI002E1CB5AA|nr:hypothetical protein [Caldifermentibacillus hisashii]